MGAGPRRDLQRSTIGPMTDQIWSVMAYRMGGWRPREHESRPRSILTPYRNGNYTVNTTYENPSPDRNQRIWSGAREHKGHSTTLGLCSHETENSNYLRQNRRATEFLKGASTDG